MELDRHFIERKDFPVARRGYDPQQVDLHLRELADAVAELRAELRSAPAGASGAAAEQVRSIVEAAEQSAAQIEQRANAKSSERLARVKEAAARMLERADSLEQQIDELLDGARAAADALVGRLRDGAGALDGELEALRALLGSLGPSGAESEPATAEDGDQHYGGLQPDPEVEAISPAEAAVGHPDRARDRPAPDSVSGNGAGEADACEPDPGPAEREETAPPAEGARLVALNMALNGAPREQTASYLADNFELDDPDALLDEVYARAADG